MVEEEGDQIRQLVVKEIQYRCLHPLDLLYPLPHRVTELFGVEEDRSSLGRVPLRGRRPAAVTKRH